MAKILGYILALVGIVGIAAYTIPQVKDAIPLPEIGDTILLVVSLALAVVGIFFIVRTGGGRRQASEVPIYRGKRVVGYRRTR